MDDVKEEIAVVMNTFGYDEDAAIGWIQSHIDEYGSVFKCDLNRYLSNDFLSKQYNIAY